MSKLSWFRLTDEEADRLNPPILEVAQDEETGKTFIELLTDEQWLPVGYIPTPRTRLGWFLYHLAHGLAMRYPFHKVIGYSVHELFRKDNYADFSTTEGPLQSAGDCKPVGGHAQHDAGAE
ncbi:MAG TPA: hypothetical protein PKE45_21925 [Caldilineaceae bacterium]|nr:hypothetical protein [Caldilineaceae bacterium]